MFINTEELTSEFTPNEEMLKKISETLLLDFYDECPDFTISFVDPDYIKSLNKEYRKVDAVTDVLSFESEGEFDPETGLEYIGDIIICKERAEEQARLSGHSLDDEIGLLEIHGLLHLLGYDHYEEEQKKEMWALQDEYLKKCGVKINRRPGEDFEF